VDTAGWALPVAVLVITAAVFPGAILAGLAVAGTVPRLLSRALKPGKVYPLYGIHYALQRAVSRLSNVGFFNALFGDSSAIVRYLGLIGYRLAPGSGPPRRSTPWPSPSRAPRSSRVAGAWRAAWRSRTASWRGRCPPPPSNGACWWKPPAAG
jgi:hypothetical protein